MTFNEEYLEASFSIKGYKVIHRLFTDRIEIITSQPFNFDKKVKTHSLDLLEKGNFQSGSRLEFPLKPNEHYDSKIHIYDSPKTVQAFADRIRQLRPDLKIDETKKFLLFTKLERNTYITLAVILGSIFTLLFVVWTN